MNRRPGATLIEVLVAIFVMAIGLLALLTLFPIGALRMAQAIMDERCAQASAIATSYATVQNVRSDSLATMPGGKDIYINPYADAPDPSQMTPAYDYGPSYPLFIDSVGYLASTGSNQSWVGGFDKILRRRPASYAINANQTATWFTLLDDLVYNTEPSTNPSAMPGMAATATSVLRDTRYSWAYLCQRAQSNEPSATSCQVVVFNKRPLTLTPGSILQESVFQNTIFDVSNNEITINSSVPPTLSPGDWVLDVTVRTKTLTVGPPGPGNTKTIVYPHGFFYRVVGVGDFDAVNSQTKVEVLGPIRGWRGLDAIPGDNVNLAAGNESYAGGVLIVLDGVAEVFERGSVRLP